MVKIVLELELELENRGLKSIKIVEKINTNGVSIKRLIQMELDNKVYKVYKE